MLINKITTGFVVQVFDTDKQKYISQNFVAGDQVDYENTMGEPLEGGKLKEYNFGPEAEQEPYLPFEMVQPQSKGHVFGEATGRCTKCGCDEDDAFVGGEPCIDEEKDNEGLDKE